MRVNEEGLDVRRTIAFVCILGAPLGLAVLDTGTPSRSWWLVAAAPVGLYCIYALGVSCFFPARVAGSAPLRTGVTPRGSRRDTDWLLLLRGLACGLVYIWHSGVAFKHDFTFGGSGWWWILATPASLGMILFFTLSGYLMGKGFYAGKYDLSRSGVTLYLRNRFLRIFPLMIVVGLLVTIWQAPQALSTPQVGARLLLFQFNAVRGAPAVVPFWSLSVEWQYYLLVPAAFAITAAALRVFIPRPKMLLPVVTLLVLGVGVVIRHYQWVHHGAAAGFGPYIYATLLGNIDVFLLGFLTNWWVPRLARHSRFIGAVWPLLVVGIYLAYVSGLSGIYGTVMILPGLVALALVPVFVGCELWNRQARLRQVPQRKTAFLLFWVGELTYPVYLVHYSILISVQNGLPHATYLARWAIATILVILVAWILHMTVEEAVLNWRRHTHRATEPDKQMAPGIRQVDLTRLVEHSDSRLAPSAPVEVDRPHPNGGRVTSPTVVEGRVSRVGSC
jgi:peptidoglycan/LPS O-acetylase OafA/YrhL